MVLELVTSHQVDEQKTISEGHKHVKLKSGHLSNVAITGDRLGKKPFVLYGT
jgi:hypothetical protein